MEAFPSLKMQLDFPEAKAFKSGELLAGLSPRTATNALTCRQG